MNKLLFGTASAALALAIPAAAQAQAIAPAVVAVVDTQRILSQCTACVAANQQLQTQRQQLEQRAQQLGQPLQTEQTAIQTAINAIPQGGQPDAALQTRIRTFQTSQENAQRELQTRQEQLRRNGAFVLQQLEGPLNTSITQIMQQRGATIAMDRAATLAINPSVEITDAVLAALNTAVTSVNVNAPAQQPAAQQPAQQQQQQQNRPQGR
ncbi:OmpH family outer membrane protein [Sphingosinicella sp. LHD-64]|uniref:OmpH family outer membrane protein n=1 Tax=Sphingosinicella sp. LHD-64 TaxID=3072139 RepID=UPI00280E7E1B|nr:OmpH family outer membrane protein [Sphingosinicella sp. LHD-64]MDQ8754830.1 OmpH family outer membrane protein [Sphingosinicella sp. LHD-64]